MDEIQRRREVGIIMVNEQRPAFDFGGCGVRILSPRARNMLKYVGGVWVCGGKQV